MFFLAYPLPRRKSVSGETILAALKETRDETMKLAGVGIDLNKLLKKKPSRTGSAPASKRVKALHDGSAIIE